MKKHIVCLKCGSKMKEHSRTSRDGKFILKTECKNPKCKAIFSMKGKSYSDVMRRLLPVQDRMRKERDAKRKELIEEGKRKAREAELQKYAEEAQDEKTL